MLRSMVRRLLGIQKNVSAEQARIVAEEAVRSGPKAAYWHGPIIVREGLTRYSVLCTGGIPGSMYVEVDIASGKVIAICGPLDA